MLNLKQKGHKDETGLTKPLIPSLKMDISEKKVMMQEWDENEFKTKTKEITY